MPRSGPGPTTGRPSTVTAPSDAVSKPAMMRSKVDLPQPEAPMRQMNWPRSMARVIGLSATTVSPPTSKRLVTPTTSSMAGSAMLRTPAQQAVVEHHHQPVGEEAGEADDDHAGDDDI